MLLSLFSQSLVVFTADRIEQVVADLNAVFPAEDVVQNLERVIIGCIEWNA